METLTDPFKVCQLNITMLKFREQVGYISLRVFVLYNNNVVRLLQRDKNF